MKNRKGFTFVELIIALAIVSLVMVTVYSAFSLGINVYNRSKKSILYNYKPYLLLERLSKDILNSLNFSNIPFSGDNASISFCGILNTGELGRTTYYLSENSLYKREESYPQTFTPLETNGLKENNGMSLTGFKEQGGATKELAKDISSLSISYYSFEPETQSYRWLERWQGTKERPLSVKIELKVLKDSGADTFIKTVSFP